MDILPDPLRPLASFAQFIVCERGGEKRPINPKTGGAHDPHDPTIWMTFEEASAAASIYGHGVGFVFTEADPFFFLDIDKCLGDDGQWSELAVNLCSAFASCAVEVSQSGRGLHIFGKSAPIEHRCKNIPLGIEFYTSRRYVALTGTGAAGYAGTDATAVVKWLVDTYFAPVEGADDDFDWTGEPVPEWSGPEDDDDLIRAMISSSSASAAFSNRASVKQLWEADVDALAKAYPPSGGGDFDHSSADAALCSHLAFWTGKNCDRMDRLFRRSGLMRDKWGERDDYMRSTIAHAFRLCRNVLGGKKSKQREELKAAGIETREGFQFMGLTQQLEHFAGCVYVRDYDAIFVPDGAMLDRGRFRSMYGGYSFAMDALGDKETRNAWEVFTESQAYSFPKAHGVCFRPECPPGAIIDEEGRKLINTYVPVQTEAAPGDVSPFINHLRALLPNENDQQILLSYMAAIVQYPGVKFQWCPVLQGVEGNGKTFFTRCLEHAVGKRYTHLPNAADLAGNGTKFNKWVSGNLFVGIEELYTADKRDLAEAMKPLITNDRIEIQGKGADQITGDNRVNFLCGSNHKDMIIKSANDRRYCIFYTAHQSAEDLVRAGWTTPAGENTEYFPNLYQWARAGGFAAINHFLQTYAIPEKYNPATVCQRAPVTSSTAEALTISLGRVEQEVLEAVDEGRPGFSGGWISSTAFDRLLEDRRDEKRIPPNKRRELLQSIGYDYHPALRDGRVNSPSAVDGGKKPRLYVRVGSILANMTDAHLILQRYTDAQQGADNQAAAAFGGQ